jgi:hypothetical protein
MLNAAAVGRHQQDRRGLGHVCLARSLETLPATYVDTSEDADEGEKGSDSALPRWSPKPGERVFVFAKMSKVFRRCPGSVVNVVEPCFATNCGAECTNHVEWGPHGPITLTHSTEVVFVKTDMGPTTVAVDSQDLRRMQSYGVGQLIVFALGKNFDSTG